MKNLNNNLNNNSVQSYNSEAERALELVMQGQPKDINSFDSGLLKKVANDNEPQQLSLDF